MNYLWPIVTFQITSLKLRILDIEVSIKMGAIPISEIVVIYPVTIARTVKKNMKIKK
jgi:hypothetical protein